MAIIEWKGKSGMGGVLDGDLTLTSPADEKVFDDFVKSLRNGNVRLILIPHVIYS